MNNHIKSVVSKLNIASIKNKSTVVIKKKKNLSNLLNFLWQEGYILGYNIIDDNYYTIYLKPTMSKNIVSINKFFKNNYITHKDSKQLVSLQKNSTYLIKTQLGIVSGKFCSKKGLGGELLVQF